jgi:hypothetical protein
VNYTDPIVKGMREIAKTFDPRNQPQFPPTGLRRLRLATLELLATIAARPAFINRRIHTVWSEPRKVYDFVSKQYAYLNPSEIRCQRTTWCICWVIPILSYDHA